MHILNYGSGGKLGGRNIFMTIMQIVQKSEDGTIIKPGKIYFLPGLNFSFVFYTLTIHI